MNDPLGVPEILGIELMEEGGRVDDVVEEDRDLPALAGMCRWCRALGHGY
jgi:hypothetical protein